MIYIYKFIIYLRERDSALNGRALFVGVTIFVLTEIFILME
jgi:hypothetical protein